MREFALLLVCLVVGHGAQALTPDRKPTQYLFDLSGRATGLPSDTVWTAREGPRGYLWIGTQNGLVRYDGLGLRIFNQQSEAAFKGSDVRDLEWTPSGELWIGTYGAGLIVMRGDDFTALDTRDGLVGNLVYDIHRTRDGALWIGTVSGLSRFEDGEFTNWTAADGLASSKVYQIAEGDDGVLWFSTLTSGLSYYDGDAFHTLNTSNGLDSNQIHLIKRDPELGIIASTATGSLYQLAAGELPRRIDWSGVAPIVDTLIDRDGTRWIGTYGAGLWRVGVDGREELVPMDSDAATEHVFDLMEDGDGTLWASTPHGLHQIRDSVFQPLGKPEGIDDSTFVVAADQSSTVWVGSERSGLFRVGADGHISQPFEELSKVSISALLPRDNGELWAGTFGAGVVRVRGDDVRWFTPDDGLAGAHVLAIIEVSPTEIWVATNSGVSRRVDTLNGGDFTSVAGLEDAFVRHLLAGRDGTVWGSSNKGLYEYTPDGLRIWTMADGLGSDFISSTYEDDRGVLWIATRDGGVARLDGDDIYTFDTRSGALQMSTFAILEDRSRNLWMTGTRGLLRTSRDNLDAVARGETEVLTTQLFDETAGLRSAQFRVGFQPTVWRAADNRFWLATTRGLSSFDPRQLGRELPAPQSYIDAVRIDGVSVPLNSPIVLPASLRRLEVDYSAPALSAARSLRFRYRGDGPDPTWEEVGPLRTAYFTSLPPGENLFRVQAQHGNQPFPDAGDTTAELSFYRTPHWYETTWAVLLACVVAALLLAFFQRLVTRNARSREVELRSLVEQRTEELREALERVEANSRIDSLTGVANRRHLAEQLSAVWNLAARSGAPVSLLMLDIDMFKQYNDTLGHNAGDACLRAIARSISGDLLRDNDMVARYGGEEFLIVLYDSDASGALGAARRIMARINDLALPHPASTVSPQVTVSIGYATATVDRVSDPQRLIEAADQALYEAKRKGRNRISARDTPTPPDAAG